MRNFNDNRTFLAREWAARQNAHDALYYRARAVALAVYRRPLPGSAAEMRAKKREQARRDALAEVVAEIMAEQLPEAVEVILRGGQNGKNRR